MLPRWLSLLSLFVVIAASVPFDTLLVTSRCDWKGQLVAQAARTATRLNRMVKHCCVFVLFVCVCVLACVYVCSYDIGMCVSGCVFACVRVCFFVRTRMYLLMSFGSRG